MISFSDLTGGFGKIFMSAKSFSKSKLWRVAIDSGLFDPIWYQESYNKSFDHPKEAWNDYVRTSAFAPVNPSPLFDNVNYHASNLDVFHSGMSPLSHYLQFGRAEGRGYVPAHARWTPGDSVPFEGNLSPEAGAMRVAVCLHIFYADFIEKFSGALESFPKSVDVFVAVRDERTADRARMVFSNCANVDFVQVVVAPNRGRNFGPLLVEFREALREYDLICHLHSKKSLYSGREQTQWADYLCEYLLRDPFVTAAALNRFAHDESVGVYYPTTFWAMPTWTNHVLMNAGNLASWQERFGLDRISGFISYPAGGMFWARPTALDQLLSSGWSYSDFPEEPLPNDGSMLHGLERIIGRIAEKDGFRELFYDPGAGKLTCDQSYIAASYRGDLSHWHSLIRNGECVGFDVFDTLLCRDFYFPDHAKLLLGKELTKRGFFDSAHEFVLKRNRSEFVARERKGFLGDVNIYEAYAVLAEHLDVDVDVANGWADEEFAFDLDLAVPRDELVALFNRLGEDGHKLWVISDTYYTVDQIALMLRKVGVSAAHRLMISSDMGLRKDNGTMWAKVKEDLSAEGISQFVHVGDNAVSDAQMPGNYGLNRTVHILNPLDKWNLMGFLPSFDSNLPSEDRINKWGKLIRINGAKAFLGA